MGYDLKDYFCNWKHGVQQSCRGLMEKNNKMYDFQQKWAVFKIAKSGNGRKSSVSAFSTLMQGWLTECERHSPFHGLGNRPVRFQPFR